MLALAVLVGGCAGQRGALQPPHSPFTRLDVDADGWLVPAELEALPALRAGFERWDSDGDGRIAWPEFQRWRGHALQAGPQGG